MRKDLINNIYDQSLVTDKLGNKNYTIIEGFLTMFEKDFLINQFNFQINPIGNYNQIIFTNNIKEVSKF